MTFEVFGNSVKPDNTLASIVSVTASVDKQKFILLQIMKTSHIQWPFVRRRRIVVENDTVQTKYNIFYKTA